MNVLDKLKLKIGDLDASSAYTGVVALAGATLAEQGINYIYALIGVFSHWHAAKIASRKADTEVARLEIENNKESAKLAHETEMNKLEAERVRIELKEREQKLNLKSDEECASKLHNEN